MVAADRVMMAVIAVVSITVGVTVCDVEDELLEPDELELEAEVAEELTGVKLPPFCSE